VDRAHEAQAERAEQGAAASKPATVGSLSFDKITVTATASAATMASSSSKGT
jgi:hypothetical protein